MTSEDKMLLLKEKFKKLYGSSEVKLPSSILTIYDSYASPFSSGSNGYLTKIRLNKDNCEFYHDWWNYGWLSFDEVKEKYPHTVCKIKSLIKCLINNYDNKTKGIHRIY